MCTISRQSYHNILQHNVEKLSIHRNAAQPKLPHTLATAGRVRLQQSNRKGIVTQRPNQESLLTSKTESQMQVATPQ